MEVKTEKLRNIKVVRVYHWLFRAMFAAWIIYAIWHLAPATAIIYNFSSPEPATYESHEDYIQAIREYERRGRAYFGSERFQREFERRQNWRSLYRRGIPHRSSSIRSPNSNLSDFGRINQDARIINDREYLYIISDYRRLLLDTYPHTRLEGTVTIVKAYPPEDMRVISRIDLIAGKTPRGGQAHGSRIYAGILLSGDNLVITSSQREDNNRFSNVAIAEIYDISNRGNPVHTRTFKLDGYLLYAHEHDGVLYLFAVKNIWWSHYNWGRQHLDYYWHYTFSNYNFYSDLRTPPPEMTDKEIYIPFYYDTAFGGKRYVAAERLHTLLPTSTDNYSFRIATISIAAIDLGANTPPQVLAYTYVAEPNSPRIYISAENNIYLLNNRLERGIEYLNILKLKAIGTNINYVVSRQVPVSSWNYWISEYNGNLRIVTSEDRFGEHLFIFDEKLNFIYSATSILGRGHERIRSAIFDENILYIVTRDNNDWYPKDLLVVDLSEATKPIITRELNLQDNLLRLELLGNGLFFAARDVIEPRYDYDWNIVRNSAIYLIDLSRMLFDTSNSYNPKELSKTKIEGDFGNIQFGRVVLSLPEHLIFAFGNRHDARLFSYDNNRLELVHTFEVLANLLFSSLTTNRLAYINNIIYYFDGKAVHAHDMNDNFRRISSVYYK